MSSIVTVICRCGNWTNVKDAGSQRIFNCAKCGAQLKLYAKNTRANFSSILPISIVSLLLIGFASFGIGKWFAAAPTVVVEDFGTAAARPTPPVSPAPPPPSSGAPEPYTAPTPDEAARGETGGVEPIKPYMPAVPEEVAEPIKPIVPIDTSALRLPPKTGSIRRARGRYEAPLRIETPAGTNFVIKMENASSGSEILLVYIHGGEIYTSKVPLGKYRFKVATGSLWYGPKKLFGPDTLYARLTQKTDPAGGVMTFWRDGRTVNGHTIQLTQVINGNLSQEKIDANEF